MSGGELADKFSLEAAEPGMEAGDKEGEHCLEDKFLEDVIPEGERYTLNSKRLKVHRVEQIAEALDIPQGISPAEKRQTGYNQQT